MEFEIYLCLKSGSVGDEEDLFTSTESANWWSGLIYLFFVSA